MDIVVITIILQVMGTIAILAELLIPSFGLLTVAALGFFGYSYFLVYQHSPVAIVFLVLINLISIPATLIFVVKRLKFYKTTTLNDTIESAAFISPVKINETGVAITDLRPAGTAQINGKHIDVYSEGNYIKKGAKVKVISTENAGVKVAEVEDVKDKYFPQTSATEME
jgi:membrane-bound serine protease (ClpP class)